MTSQLEQGGSAGFYKTFFMVAAVYDAILGAVFLLLYAPVYQFLSISLPENPAYLHMIAGFVFVQGLGYWFVSRNMERNVDLVKAGAVYKAVYVLVTLNAMVAGHLPHAMFAWFAACDALFFVWFIRFLMLARPAAPMASKA